MVRKLVVSVRIIFIIEQSHVTSIVDLADRHRKCHRAKIPNWDFGSRAP